MKKEYDLKKMKGRSNKYDPNANKVQISMRLNGGLISQIKEEASKLGIPYQTLIQSILHQYVNGELVSSSQLQNLKKALG